MRASRIALDVLGGDHAPDAVLKGALQACDPNGEQALDPSSILLAGDETTIRGRLEALGGNPGFGVLHAPEAIGMHEKPGQALRAKPNSSIVQGIGAVKQGGAGAFVSMGNTGAVVGAATLGLGTLEGVRRPGIAVTLDLTGHPVTFIDMGANIVPKAQHLYQYAVMGSIYTRDCLGKESPRIGLLNIGEEPSKGTELLREAHGILTQSSLEFVGNLESNDVFTNKADVVVCDGFTGNVVLKLLESFAAFMMGLVMGQLKAHDVKWGPEALAKVQKNIDYSEYGGALLLGVAGIVIIGHGRSDANAVANALGLASRALEAHVNEDIVKGLEGGPEKVPSA